MATAVATVEAGSGQNKIVAAKKQVIGILMLMMLMMMMIENLDLDQVIAHANVKSS